jgi:RHS repeat-associated protein
VGSPTRTLTVPSGNPGSISFAFSAGYTWEYSKNGGTFTTLTNGGSVSFANNNTIAVKLFGIGCSDGDTLTATDATTGASVGTFDASNTGTCSGQSPQFGGPNTPSSTVTIFSVWDGDWAILEEYDASGNRVQGYVQGYHGLVKTLVDNIYYYQDELGSTSHIASSSGQLLEYYKYNLYGKPRYFNAAGTEQGASSYRVQDLGNGGSRWIPELSLYDDRNRFMSPDLGRFLQPDPIGFKGDASNLYRYCGNDWANRTDPTGLDDTNLGLKYGTEVGARTTENAKLEGDSQRWTLEDLELRSCVYAPTANSVQRAEQAQQAAKDDAASKDVHSREANASNVVQAGQTISKPAAAKTSEKNDADLTVFAGYNASGIPFLGSTFSLGGYVSPQGVGIYCSYGGGFGLDVSHSAVFGYTKTNLDGFRGPYDNTSFGIWKIGGMALRSNGETVGHAITLGPGLTPISGSQTHTNTVVTPPVKPPPPILAGPF